MRKLMWYLLTRACPWIISSLHMLAAAPPWFPEGTSIWWQWAVIEDLHLGVDAISLLLDADLDCVL